MPSPRHPTRHVLSLGAACARAFALAACGGHAPADTGKDQDLFLKNNKAEKGVVTLGDGVQYRIVHSGPADGPHPDKGDEIKLNYTGSLLSGSVFDSTKATGAPAVMRLDNLIPAWMEVLPKMRPGDEWLVYAPPAMAYGADGRPPVIPPNSLLIFDVTLLGVLKPNGGTQYATQLPEGPSPIVNATGQPAPAQQ